MISIVTSTLKPIKYSLFTNQERLKQTLHTLERLTEIGFDEIYLLDNSPIPTSELGIQPFGNVKVVHKSQYSFNNKSLNEALLILNNLSVIPDNTPIFKISARYFPNKNFDITNNIHLIQKEFVGVGYTFEKATSAFSTRAYFVRDKSVLETTLVLAIEEMISYSKGIHGLKSMLQAFYSYFKTHIGVNYQLSLEQSFARILKSKRNFHLLKRINVEGYLAGSGYNDFISE